jgi:D-threo-aldose 1-dehydrogenase
MIDALPPFGLGGAAIGNLYRATSDADAEATIHAALAGRLGFIDTAPFYGHGRSETRIGAALKSWAGPRPLLSSKVGRVLDPVMPGEEGDFGFADPMPFRPRFDYSRAGVRASLEASLTRLGVDKLDIALVHDISPLVHGDEYPRQLKIVLDEALPELEAARAEGLVARIGLGVNETATCLDISERAPLDCVLLAGRYTLLEQGALTSCALDALHARGVSVIAAGVFNSGLLASAPSPESTYNYQPAPADMLARAARIWRICAGFGIPAQAAALRFPGAHPAIACVLVGARSAGEIADLLRWRAAAIPNELWAALTSERMLAEGAPTPKT